MKHEVWESLTPKGKEICAHLKADEGEVLEPVEIDISEGLTAGGPGSNVVPLGFVHTERGFTNTAGAADRFKIARL